MNTNIPPNMADAEPEMNPRAVSIYGQDSAADDFPVLKAFQQYIDAEQAKARKRLVSMAVFFGIFTLVVIAVFVSLLIGVSERNQKLNDRLIDFAMQERERPAPVVVQPHAQPQDNAAVLALTDKLEKLQDKLAESQRKAEEAQRKTVEAQKAAEEAAARAAAPKGPSAQELEIARLKALLEDKRKDEARRAAEEKERKRQEELDAYRRQHYPELYGLAPKKETRGYARKGARNPLPSDDVDELTDDELDAEIEAMQREHDARIKKAQKAKTAQKALKGDSDGRAIAPRAPQAEQDEQDVQDMQDAKGIGERKVTAHRKKESKTEPASPSRNQAESVSTKPATAESETTKPVTVKHAVTTPVKTKTVANKSVETKTVATNPVATKPDETKTAATKTVETKTVSDKPKTKAKSSEIDLDNDSGIRYFDEDDTSEDNPLPGASAYGKGHYTLPVKGSKGASAKWRIPNE